MILPIFNKIYFKISPLCRKERHCRVYVTSSKITYRDHLEDI